MFDLIEIKNSMEEEINFIQSPTLGQVSLSDNYIHEHSILVCVYGSLYSISVCMIWIYVYMCMCISVCACVLVHIC